MQRLLWVTNIPSPYRVPLWQELRNSVDLDVLTMAAVEPNRRWDGDQLLADAGATNIKAARLSLGDIWLYLPTRRLITDAARTGTTVYVDGWESPAYLAAMRAARRAGNRVILGYRGHAGTHRFSSGPVAKIRRRIFHQADAVVTAGAPSTTEVLSMGIRADRVVEGVNAVDVASFAAKSHRLRWKHDGHRFLVVAQFIERKNIAAVISAFDAIRQPTDRLRIIGSGPLETALRTQIAELGLNDSVDITGPTFGDDLVEAYANADTVVLASTEEVFGLVVPEGLACGAHAVVSEHCGVADSVRGMRGVEICRPDVAGIAAAMKASRSSRRGPIITPQILAHSVQAAAASVLDAVNIANGRPTQPRTIVLPNRSAEADQILDRRPPVTIPVDPDS